jgi:MFS transporter, PPP family, 3-phenylpropionic acid transporter
MPNIARITFFIMCVHLALGASLPYLPVWLGVTKGLSGAQIGIILASSSFGRIIMGPLAAAWAEGRDDSRTPLLVFSLSVALGYLVYPLLGPFWPIALACFFVGIASQCLGAFAEAATFNATANSVSWPYGRARAMGSVAFAVASLGAGAVVQSFGVDAVYIWFVAATFCTFLCSLWIEPELRYRAIGKPLIQRLKGGFKLFAKPAFLIGTIAAGLIQSAHAFYYGFCSTLWLAQGFTGTQVGLLWALGVGVEVLFLAFGVAYVKHIRPEMMILIGGVGSLIRWSAMSFGLDLAPSLVIQALHAVTFGITHMGLMRLLEREITPDQRGTGQQLSSSLIMSPAMGLASIGAGVFYDQYKLGGYWSGVCLAGLGVFLVFGVLVLGGRRPRSAQR